MCDVCNKARKLPLPEALKVIAQALQVHNAPKCLDKLVGELVGEPEPEVDLDAEAAYEARRRGK